MPITRKAEDRMFDHYQLLDHLSIGVFVLDESLQIKVWNKWLMEHSLLGRDEVVGKPIIDFFPGLARKGFIKKARDVFRLGKPVFFTQQASQFIFPFPTTRSYLTTKLSAMQQTVILSPLKNDQGETVDVLVSVFDVSDWVAHQNQLLKSKKELERLSQVDELTQIPNRRSIMEKLREELLLHNRKNRPMAVAMIDIDHFKNVNDTHGHQCGDVVLLELAGTLSNCLRGYDVVGRYGGEEFVVLLPETSSEQAMMVCERLRQAVESMEFRFEEVDIKLTISVGIALKEKESPGNAEDLLKVADDCLYRAKSAGRNRVILPA